MAKELIGGAFISATIQLLVEKIASPEILNYFLRRKDSSSDSDDLLKRLKMKAIALTAVLDDAEQRQIRDDPRVEAWLDGVQDAVLDAEDLLDEIAAAEDQAEPSRAGKRRKKISFGLFSRDDNPSSVTERRVKKLIERLEDIARQKDLLGLKETAAAAERRVARKKLPSTSLVEESEVYGRDEDKEGIIEILLDDRVAGEKICVVPVTGMAGVGKTTLAQVVFNDPRVQKNFPVKAWVHVSEDFDICGVTRRLIGSDRHSDDDEDDLNSLQIRLREKLAGKKFLFVLDDVWNEDYLDWDLLRTPFKAGALGSKILVSTRSSRVGEVMGTVPGRQLAGLSEEACRRLFARHAGRFSGNPELERIGREIVRKCNGLPLAVKTLGGVLRSTRDVGEWERVSRSEIWELKGVQREILPALRLSYHYLPSPLKRCFAYCSIFPKDYRFDREELVLLWMAENLLDYPKRTRGMEDVGDEYFGDLVSRSFLQQSGTSSSYVMHDLFVDLAKSVSKKYCFLSETCSGGFNQALVARARYFAYVPRQHNMYERFGSVLRADRLRTFLPVRSMFSYTLSKEVVDDLFSKLRRLRVLSLSGYKTAVQLPDSIGELTHLRYLNLSSTSISSLSESVTMLVNLQTLRLACCFRLVELPKNFHRLVNLRYLDITSSGVKELPESLCLLSNLQTLKLSRCHFLTKLPDEFHRLVNLRKLEVEGSGLEGMPVQIRQLKCLQTLSTFIVGQDVGAKIGESGGLSDLRGTLHIKNLQNVSKPEEALEARLRDKRFLEGLRLEWGKSSPLKHDREVLDSLLPNTNLKKLEFICYGGTEFPSWLGLRSFCNVVEISLLNCARCLTLPPLGQLTSLKILQIKGFDSVVRVGSEFYGENSLAQKPFACLEVLDIRQMRKWKEWSTSVRDSEAFPKLRKLCIESCTSLKGDLPKLLPSLTELSVSMCDRLLPSLPVMPNIAKIELKMCQNLSRVMEPHVMESFTRLQHLEISSNSISIQLNRLPVSMKTLKIQSYRSLEFQLRESTNSLEELSMECSDEGSFTPGFPLDSFPNIRTLRIGGCQDLVSLWTTSSSEGLKSLSTLVIANCPDSTLFPRNTAPFQNLTSLTVRNCRKLTLLSENLQSLVPSLETLTIRGCPVLSSFSKSGLPSALRWLTVAECHELINARAKWNLQRLVDLQSLIVGECDNEDMEAFPEEGLLPSSITELSIWYLECLETLNNRGLQKLTSLKQLTIYDCPNLQTMTDAALPASLESLRINRCPLLQEKCRKETGKYWEKISHIPWIYLDYKLVSQ